MSTKMCAKWCGAGCTKEEHDAALRIARRTAKDLGPGWKPRVHENLGWHARVTSSCCRISVSIHHDGVHSYTYTAFFGESGDVCVGRWAAHAPTPRTAVRRVIAIGVAELAKMGAIIQNLPKVPR